MDGQRHAPAALPQKRDPVATVQEAGWAPGVVWTTAKDLTPQGFDYRTVHPAASRYTDCAIAAHLPYILVSTGLNTNIIYKTSAKRTSSVKLVWNDIELVMITINYVISLLNSCQLRPTAQRDETSGVTYINNSVLHCTSPPLRLRNILLHKMHEIPCFVHDLRIHYCARRASQWIVSQAR
jgi:hypothetical protein